MRGRLTRHASVPDTVNPSMSKNSTLCYGAIRSGKSGQLFKQGRQLSSCDNQPNARSFPAESSSIYRPIATFRSCIAAAVTIAVLILLWALTPSQNRRPSRKLIGRSRVPFQDAVAPTILISLDGFRHEYLSRRKKRDDGIEAPLAPNLRNIAANGAYAINGMQPVMPTKTKPNHWALVTGLFAESGGIVGNQMYDPDRQVWFKATRGDPEWYFGSPIWQTLRHTPRTFVDAGGVLSRSEENYTTACVGWPGSEIQKYAANAVWDFDDSVPYEERVIKAISLLNGTSLDLQRQAQFVTLYFKAVDIAGHRYGPNSCQVNDAIEKVDNTIAFLLSTLGKRASELYNIVVISDHGMTEMIPERTIDLTSSIRQGTVQDITRSPMGLFMNISMPAEEIYTNIQNGLRKHHGHATAYLKRHLPTRWHLRKSRLIADVVTMAELGWTVRYPHQHILPVPSEPIQTRQQYKVWLKGNHGFDNTLEDMQAIFIAQGPAFKPGSVAKNMRSVDIYRMLCYIFFATPSPNNGTLETTSSILKPHS